MPVGCKTLNLANEATPEMASGVKEVSQQTEDCNAERWQFDRGKKGTGRCTEQTKHIGLYIACVQETRWKGSNVN